MNEVAVVRAGTLTTVQDRGRPGLARLGVPPSGAADQRALELGNRTVGNDPGAAALEATLIGPALRFAEPALVAVTGAEADATVSGRPLERGRPVEVPAGDLLELGRCRDGLRAYISVRGGFAVEPTLGSRSHDLLTGLGPPPLRARRRSANRAGARGAAASSPGRDRGTFRPAGAVASCRGRETTGSRRRRSTSLTEVAWRVGPASNRIGIRLEGPALARLDRGELLSEGLVTGAIQVPPSGHPIVLGPDHPTTGGYPVIAVVLAADLPLAGQLAPGSSVRFRRA